MPADAGKRAKKKSRRVRDIDEATATVEANKPTVNSKPKKVSTIKTKASAAKRGSGRGSKKVEEGDDGNGNTSESEGGPDTEDNATVDWRDTALTWSLINAIEEEDEIKNSLFLPVGPTTSSKNGGGKPKTDFQYKVAKKIFASHPCYGNAFNKAATAAAKGLWINKIKNRLKVLTKQTCEQIIEMGQTGAGIDSEDQIEASTSLTTKWDMIKEVSPWFFKMRDLINNRPNLIPTGVGNNATMMDTSILLTTPGRASAFELSEASTDLDTLDTMIEGAGFEGDGDHDDDVQAAQAISASDSDSASDASLNLEVLGRKRKHRLEKVSNKDVGKPDIKPDIKGKRTPARPGISTPAGPGAGRSSKKAKTTIDKFAEISKAEEETVQKRLEAKEVRAKADAEERQARLKAQVEISIEKARLKAQLQREQAKYEHQLKMAQIQQFQQFAQMFGVSQAPRFDAASFSGPSLVTVPSSSVVAGPSTFTAHKYSQPAQQNMPFQDVHQNFADHGISSASDGTPYSFSSSLDLGDLPSFSQSGSDVQNSDGQR